MWAGAVQAFPPSFSQSPFISACCCFYTVSPYGRNVVSLLCGQTFSEFWDETSTIFPLCRVCPGVFTGAKLVLWYRFPLRVNRGWGSHASDLVASFCSPLHPENIRRMQWEPISKESGKRHLLIAMAFKQRLNRDIGGFLSLFWGPWLNEDGLLQSSNRKLNTNPMISEFICPNCVPPNSL